MPDKLFLHIGPLEAGASGTVAVLVLAALIALYLCGRARRWW
jgi:hypothetical protein